MPIRIISIRHDTKELEAEAFGPIHYREIEKHLTEERFVGGLTYKEFIDARDARLSFFVSPFEIRQIVKLIHDLGKQSKFGRTAVLVSTEFNAGIMHAMGMLVEDVAELVPFMNEEEARSWLDRPDQ
jgi:hypothetical protein